MFLVSPCNFLCPIYWSQVLSREWRRNWSGTHMWCSNYNWVIYNCNARGAFYIAGLTVCVYICVCDGTLRQMNCDDLSTEKTWFTVDAYTQLPLVPHICVNELGQQRFRYWLVAYLAHLAHLHVLELWTLQRRLWWRWHIKYNVSVWFCDVNKSYKPIYVDICFHSLLQIS